MDLFKFWVIISIVKQKTRGLVEMRQAGEHRWMVLKTDNLTSQHLHVMHHIVLVVEDWKGRLVVVQVRVVVVLLWFVAVILPWFGRIGGPQAEWRTRAMVQRVGCTEEGQQRAENDGVDQMRTTTHQSEGTSELLVGRHVLKVKRKIWAVSNKVQD